MIGAIPLLPFSSLPITLMNKTISEKVAATFRTSVREAVAKGNHSRWGEGESAQVIEALVELLVSDDEVSADGYDAIREQVRRVINPSAFAQGLEDLPDGSGKDKDGQDDKDADGNPKPAHPSFIRRVGKGKRGGKAMDV